MPDLLRPDCLRTPEGRRNCQSTESVQIHRCPFDQACPAGVSTSYEGNYHILLTHKMLTTGQVLGRGGQAAPWNWEPASASSGRSATDPASC